jgi:hypothetical protein
MKEKPRRRITLMSSFNEIVTAQMGNRMYLYGYDDRSVIPPAPPLSTAGFWIDRYIFNDDVNGFSFISDICFLQCTNEKSHSVDSMQCP